MGAALRSVRWGWRVAATAWLVSGCAAEEEDVSVEAERDATSARQGHSLQGDGAASAQREPGDDSTADSADACGDAGAALERCDTDWGPGLRHCADKRWSACGVLGECAPGEGGMACEQSGEPLRCVVSDGVWSWDRSECPAPTGGGAQGSSTPLLLSFAASPVRFTRAAGSFDLAGLEATIATAWVGAETPWLVLDRNGNGRIDDGAELFGSMTVLPDGGRAPHGFAALAALAALDGNGDGRIDPQDPAWHALRLWSDRDQDRSASVEELRPLEAYGVRSISLDYSVQARCVATACERERAEIVFERDGVTQVGAVIDVHLNHL